MQEKFFEKNKMRFLMNKLSFPPSFCFSYKKLLRFYETYFFSSIVNLSCFHLETRKCLLGNKAFFS